MGISTKDNRCFADNGEEKCKALRHKFCNSGDCRFFKTEEQFKKDREKYGFKGKED